jgi:hypothetical protein
LPHGLPNLIIFHLIWGNEATKLIEKEKFINNGVPTYVEFWKMGMCKDETYAKKFGPYLDYWENILELLSKPLPTQSSTLLEGIWPSNNWKFNHVRGVIPLLLMLILKTQLSLHIVVPKTL